MQPDEVDPLARLGEWLLAAGAELDIVLPEKEALPTEWERYRGVVCLGGAMGAGDDLDYPWLTDIRRLLAGSVTARRPVLAVCLGAQLLAMACGGLVERGAAGPEIGPGLVAKRDLAWRDPLFADLPFMPDVLQFHDDVVVRLPANSELLASSARYPNQAFRIGPSADGIQFHIETTPEIVLDWAKLSPESAKRVRPGELDPDRLVELHRDLEETWRPFVTRFVRLVSGDLQPISLTRPSLPLV